MSVPPPIEAPVFARQPIVDAAGELVGYELLVPAGSGRALEAVADATSGPGDHAVPTYVTLDATELLGAETLPFDPALVVLQLPAELPPDPSLLSRIDVQAAAGYRFGLNGHPDIADPAILERVSSVRLDASTPGAAESAKLHGLPAMAANVLTADDFARCREDGFGAFQGPFLTRAPDNPTGAAPASIARLRAATDLQLAEDVDDLERAISLDGVLSIGLLRFVNSAAFPLRSQIKSVRHAVALLGPPNVRQWATLVLLSSAAPGPRWRALGVTGLARARTCEAIARRMGECDPESFFLVGLLSVTDALLDTSLETLLDELLLADDVVQALKTRAGAKGHALAVAEACERGDWEQAILPEMDPQLLAVLHTAALRWSDAAVAGLA